MLNIERICDIKIYRGGEASLFHYTKSAIQYVPSIQTVVTRTDVEEIELKTI